MEQLADNEDPPEIRGIFRANQNGEHLLNDGYGAKNVVELIEQFCGRVLQECSSHSLDDEGGIHPQSCYADIIRSLEDGISGDGRFFVSPDSLGKLTVTQGAKAILEGAGLLRELN